jgi:hypothetical protein
MRVTPQFKSSQRTFTLTFRRLGRDSEGGYQEPSMGGVLTTPRLILLRISSSNYLWVVVPGIFPSMRYDTRE